MEDIRKLEKDETITIGYTKKEVETLEINGWVETTLDPLVEKYMIN